MNTATKVLDARLRNNTEEMYDLFATKVHSYNNTQRQRGVAAIIEEYVFPDGSIYRERWNNVDGYDKNRQVFSVIRGG